MFKDEVLGTSQSRHYADATLGRPWDVSPKLMRHWINSNVFTSWWYAETIL